MPLSWTELHATIMHKQWDPRESLNYRYISLVNTTKIFTQILHERLVPWAESAELLPERFQSGFRKKKGTSTTSLF